MIKKILVANRGEIAVRIIRTCREMDIKSIAVFSDADRTSLHVRYADEAYRIGPPPSAESYLNMDAIIKIAKKSKADAIHPGYGFLSENAEFAEKVRKAGLIFIGPSAEAIIAMGDKMRARELMQKAEVPVVPGTGALPDDEAQIKQLASKIGYPVMIKASAGGGGKGMRLVHSSKDLISSYRRARSEAASAFGNDAVYLEKYLEEPHHIEFQILADNHGNVIHLFERECSVQRRHQKVIEETPSPFLTEETRQEMAKHAISAAKSVNYSGAGTIEFLMDKHHHFYFLEMNTRLQVEHPITERVTGVDLVKAQIHIANNEPLHLQQEELKQSGHAIEARIYAEDPYHNFMPGSGLIRHISEPLGLGMRTDGYVFEGYEVPVYYDPLISKLIIWAPTRSEAIDRMKRALYEYKITGIKTNIAFIQRIMEAKDFIDGNYNTHFIEENLDFLLQPSEQSKEIEDIAMIIAYLDYQNKQNKRKDFVTHQQKHHSNWKNFGRLFRHNPY
ncbi:acetyl-CoA carboxylase biotin carboxylase subunit [Alkalitalea saponilacus]|uniref:Acetyl-CoA carboxylase, biotin carboxylase subunit n=1 Tax=Alkalitalea saponilacus TaxID=889453 RepID=A0A1T5D311_9BACT|nr:acetyl-CoA carboxylase biotin carboxylase subunit [Alkalitalea saponilacus]ASB50556.1 acetyl-CoA carboxylase biotin carboxylase subunit [Alkalitalea saponilacus]SKB66039.1 acetyl-CoA carboxylase, biotin carboxylase subunit [Alkalitalea saponilacus]